MHTLVHALATLVTFTSNVLSQAPDAVGYMRKEYSIVKPLAGPGSLQSWDLLGTAYASNDYIRLTPDARSSQGGIWSQVPCYTRDWEIHIHFHVHGAGTSLFGDGFAFWFVRDRSEIGGVFGSKDQFSGLGVFFDTYANQNGEHSHEHPYISAQINNGSMVYDHDRDGTHSEAGGCSAAFRSADADTFAAIRYLGTENRLTVQYDISGTNEWKECFDLSGITLPVGYYLGLSAATGDLSDNHDILSFKFYDLESPENEITDEKMEELRNVVPSATNAEDAREHVEDPTVTTKTQKFFYFLYFLLFVVVVGAIGGFIYYQKKQQDDKKRFY